MQSIKFIFSILFCLVIVPGKSQDSAKQKVDSSQVDSISKKLLLELEELKNTEEIKRLQLQRALDSIQGIQANRKRAILLKIDSLRGTTSGVPVVVFNDTLMYFFERLGSLSPKERANRASRNLEVKFESGEINSNSLKATANDEAVDLILNGDILFTITEKDAYWLEKTPIKATEDLITTLLDLNQVYQEKHGILVMVKRIGLLILVLIILWILIRLVNRGITKLNDVLIKKFKPYLNGLKFKNYEFLSEDAEIKLVRWCLKVTKWLLILFLLYITLPVIFSIFPTTKGIATTLIGYILNPLKKFTWALVGYIPNLITIAVVVLVTNYFIRAIRFFASEIESGKLQIPGFYADWAGPTFKLLKIVVYAFAFVIIFPYLPGSKSPIFQGVSVFFGLLISLGSSSAISNIIAGLVITYMRPFKIGDRVKIGETTGDIVEKTLLVTRVRTIKNEDISIPNSTILVGSTVNYSSSSESLGLILNSTVTIGYDVPWRKVHDLLISAALKADFINKEPAPFVLQTSLDDFYVSYQINAYTNKAGMAAKIYSQLHANIQDAFNEAGVEILSPHYRAARDGNTATLPPEYLPKGYQAPRFNVNLNQKPND
ncbi:mechanosensitive ion channel family protein [Luteibaculum oceani]|uniref:Mechanosensitive ion channel family protein n=1 Tax=Luteibaculum oceani TaxID=1294296 RepID=A0A5C6USF4_9FLAO|nr:mechanosensitive ion channel family protein [Luteibaculum oceani]TXC76263.1 mechanosensitive ion channel family protein [Luteibaculum oceani]